MWRWLDRIHHVVTWLSTLVFFYGALFVIQERVADETMRLLLYLGVAGLWGNLASLLTYYRRRLKQLAPEEM